MGGRAAPKAQCSPASRDREPTASDLEWARSELSWSMGDFPPLQGGRPGMGAVLSSGTGPRCLIQRRIDPVLKSSVESHTRIDQGAAWKDFGGGAAAGKTTAAKVGSTRVAHAERLT